MTEQKIIYSRGYPFGAPLVMLRGGGTRTAKEKLKELGFRWNGQSHAWETYMGGEEFRVVLLGLRADGYKILAKESMDAGYLLDLGEESEETAAISGGAEGEVLVGG